MAKWVHADVLDNGIAYIKANCNKMALVSAYSAGDSYATVNAAIVADTAMANGDFTIAASGNNRTLTTASGKSDTAANVTGGGVGNHIAFLDTVNSKVLWVTNETSGQSITVGNPVSFPSLVYTVNQPT